MTKEKLHTRRRLIKLAVRHARKGMALEASDLLNSASRIYPVSRVTWFLIRELFSEPLARPNSSRVPENEIEAKPLRAHSLRRPKLWN